ncbi:hypothetical protein H6P81_001236 [Aristolochia fimbriata]|uniref:Uncharacterized protein n=1 Tax=Aristolochia fimbriata TaxID=158543 RepID=A0AAV7F6M2_ARIFI|nr:hypothetical protein H6P81_001236 [Aristolochia fimbriata]
MATLNWNSLERQVLNRHLALVQLQLALKIQSPFIFFKTHPQGFRRSTGSQGKTQKERERSRERDVEVAIMGRETNVEVGWTEQRREDGGRIVKFPPKRANVVKRSAVEALVYAVTLVVGDNPDGGTPTNSVARR